MSRIADEAALAGVAVAGIISISSSDGRYEPFDAATGIVLAILLASFYRPQKPAAWREALYTTASGASVIALVFCIIISPIVDWTVEKPLSAYIPDNRVAYVSVVVSWRLSAVWLGAFVVVGILLAMRMWPREANKLKKTSTP